jgi:endo-1,4-beta-xylanase
MIVVFNNGGPAWHYDAPESRQMGETALIDELILLIDRTFRTIADRRGRAIEGMSMGGRGTIRAIFKHPELFCSAAALAAGIGNEQKAVDAGLHRENNVFYLARRYAADPQPPIRFLLVVGTKDVNYASNLEYMTLLRDLKIPFDQMVLDGVAHSNREYYERMHTATLRYHAESFQWAQR